MATSICTNCLSRIRLSSMPALLLPLVSVSAASAFHTSATLHANNAVLKKKPNVARGTQVKHRQSRSAVIKKKARERPTPPAPGERRALRKRIVLSNTNALEVAGMEDLSLENMADPEQVGNVLGLNGPLLDQLRHAKVFKTTQNWNMFRRPGTMVRKESVELGRRFQEVNSSREGEGTEAAIFRQIINGKRSTGKSLLLLQAMSMAFINGFVVINVPAAQDFTIGQSSYAPLPQSIEVSEQEQQYIQPHLTADLLSRVAYSNEEVLKKLKLSHKHTSIPMQLRPNTTLFDLANMGAQEPSNAWLIWQAFWKELTERPLDESTAKTSVRRPPILIAIDDLDHWMTISQYRSAEYHLIHSHQFALIRQFISLLFAQTAPATSAIPSSDLELNGGMVLAATSSSNSPSAPSLDVLLRQLRARAVSLQLSDAGFPMPKPYSKVDQRVLNLLNGGRRGADKTPATEVTTLEGLSKQEARSLLEYFAKSGILKENINEAVVGEKWSLSGGGVIGELAKFGKRLRL